MNWHATFASDLNRLSSVSDILDDIDYGSIRYFRFDV